MTLTRIALLPMVVILFGSCVTATHPWSSDLGACLAAGRPQCTLSSESSAINTGRKRRIEPCVSADL